VAQDEIAQATGKAFGSVEKRLKKIESTMATKKDLERFGTKKDLEKFATKDMLGQVLFVVETIEVRLKSWEHIPKMVDRLHKRVFPR